MSRSYICLDCFDIAKAGSRGRVKERCPDCARKRAKLLAAIWAKDHPEIVRRRAKAWRDRNRKHCREKAAEYRRTHREQLRIYNTAYQRERRARLKALEESAEQ